MEHYMKIPVRLLGSFDSADGNFDGDEDNLIDLNNEIGTAKVNYAVHDDDCSTYSIALTDSRVNSEYEKAAEEGREFEVDHATWERIEDWVQELDNKYFD